VPITCGQAMPAPSVHARFLSLLESHVQPGAAVLDLGAGEWGALLPLCWLAATAKTTARLAGVLLLTSWWRTHTLPAYRLRLYGRLPRAAGRPQWQRAGT
jgi:hypothetical protein